MKLAIVYGTRPEFLKIKPLVLKLIDEKFDFKVIKINQHKNLVEDTNFYADLLDIDDSTTERISSIGSNILNKLPSLIKDCTHILAQGDTASVFYSLLCGFQMNKKCIHLEAGLRTYDLDNPFPEEAFRQMISRITDIHLCPSIKEIENLEIEKVKGSRFIVGNTILDLVKSYDIKVTYEDKVLITLHRRENWYNFKNYIVELINLAKNNPLTKYYFICHPNPQLQIIIKELSDSISSNFNILDSLNHYDMIKLLSCCKYVITDSGGIQEEANFLGKHIYLLRKITERNNIDLSKISLIDINDICKIKDFKQYDPGYEYGKGDSVEKIIEILKNLI